MRADNLHEAAHLLTERERLRHQCQAAKAGQFSIVMGGKYLDPKMAEACAPALMIVYRRLIDEVEERLGELGVDRGTFSAA